VKLFLLAHQDDEFACFSILESYIQNSEACSIIYLTKGTIGNISPKIRNNESITVLRKLGITDENIHFLGETLDIDDGQLPSAMMRAWEGLLTFVNSHGTPSSITTLAWEAGHQDHDATHILATALAKKLNILATSSQFPLYRSSGRKLLFYKVLSTLDQNGPTTKTRIPIASRLRYLTYCLLYRSQLKTWLGLLPFVFLDYIVSGTQKTQNLRLETLNETPNKSEALYQIRGVYEVEEFTKYAAEFKAKVLS